MPWTTTDWVALAITAAALATLLLAIWTLPEWLDSWTARNMGPGVPQRARWILNGIAITAGVAVVLASLLAPFPPVYGAALLLAAPIWGRRVRKDRKVPFIVPIEQGMADSTTIAYVLASLATLVGIIRLGPG